MKKKNMNIPVIVFTQFENKRYEERCKNAWRILLPVKKRWIGTVKRCSEHDSI